MRTDRENLHNHNNEKIDGKKNMHGASGTSKERSNMHSRRVPGGEEKTQDLKGDPGNKG